jgi:hypothetical protein
MPLHLCRPQTRSLFFQPDNRSSQYFYLFYLGFAPSGLEESNNGVIARRGCRIERCPTSAISESGICTSLSEQNDGSVVALTSGMMECILSTLISLLDVSFSLQQERDGRILAVLRGVMKCRLSSCAA